MTDDVDIKQLAEKLKANIKQEDRRYHLRTYVSCFVASEAVEWMMKEYGVTEEKAVAWGQQLVEKYIIYHVAGRDQFENEYLFFRFQATVPPDPHLLHDLDPLDEYNEVLKRNAHPADYANPTPQVCM